MFIRFRQFVYIRILSFVVYFSILETNKWIYFSYIRAHIKRLFSCFRNQALKWNTAIYGLWTKEKTFSTFAWPFVLAGVLQNDVSSGAQCTYYSKPKQLLGFKEKALLWLVSMKSACHNASSLKIAIALSTLNQNWSQLKLEMSKSTCESHDCAMNSAETFLHRSNIRQWQNGAIGNSLEFRMQPLWIGFSDHCNVNKSKSHLKQFKREN